MIPQEILTYMRSFHSRPITYNFTLNGGSVTQHFSTWYYILLFLDMEIQNKNRSTTVKQNHTMESSSQGQHNRIYGYIKTMINNSKF